MADEARADPITPPLGQPEERRVASVRFAIDVQRDESLPGIVARSAVEHVLLRLDPILLAAGIDIYTPGAVLTCDPTIAEKLASVLRQEHSAVSTRLVRREGSGVVIGDLALPVGALELRARRIGPRSLENSPHHRSAWLNRFLACCPTTGEFLVEDCQACGGRLGWTRSRGIGICEHCGSTVSPSALPPLAATRLDHYRAVAELMALNGEERTAARSRLPRRLRRFDPGTLAITALQLAGVTNQRDGLGADIGFLKSCDPVLRADLACRAGAILSDWPITLRAILRERLDVFADDHEQFFRMWRTLKRHATASLFGATKRELILDGFPDLEGNIWKSFVGSARTYTTQDAMLVLGISGERTRRLGDVKHMTAIAKPSRYRGNRQFLADKVDALRDRKDRAINMATIGEKRGIPLYGVEQLAAARKLDFLGDPEMAAAFPRPMVTRESSNALLTAIDSARAKTERPSHARRLSECIRLLGGAEKPWPQVLGAIIEGDLCYWSAEDAFNLRSAFVLPFEMRQFLGVRFKPADRRFPFRLDVAKREAAELLTIDSPQFEAHLPNLGLAFDKNGRRKDTPKSRVLKLARAIVSNAELAEHWSILPKAVRYDPRVALTGRRAFGWDRASLITAGVIPDTL